MAPERAYSWAILRGPASALCLTLAALATAAFAAPASAEPAVGIVDHTKILVHFDTANPSRFISAAPISGVGQLEQLEDVDFRWHPNGALSPVPPSGLFAISVLAGLEYKLRLWTVDSETGVATAVGSPFGVVPGGNNFGIDFNPTADRIRGVNDFDANFRVNPDNGARADSPTADVTLNPAGMKVSSLAYDRVDIPIPPSVSANTTAYAIGSNPSDLFTIGGINSSPSPNGGTLSNAKPLGVTITPGSPIGFDIAPGGTAYASLVVGSQPGLYSVNLSTGAATLVGNLPETLSGMAVVPATAAAPPPDTTPPDLALKGVKSSMSLTAFLKGVKAKVTPSEPAKLEGKLLAAARSAQLSSFNLTLATKSLKLGSGQRTLKLKPGKKLVGHPRKKFKVQLQVTATDATGNARTVKKTVKVKPGKPKR